MKSQTRIVAQFALTGTLFALANLCYAQDTLPTSSIELRAGVIIDPEASHVYVMSPDDSVEALNIGDGELVWKSFEVAKPLAVSGGLLIGQTISAGEDAMGVAVVNAREQGRSVSTGVIEMPPGVLVHLDDSLDGRFVSTATTMGDKSYIAWDYMAVPVKAMNIFSDPEQVEGPTLQPTPVRGYAEVDLQSGHIEYVSEMPPSITALQRDLTARISGLSEQPGQRASKDGRHLLTSKRIADDLEWNKYEWTIIDVASGETLGRIRSHVSHTDFVVVDSRVMYVTDSYSRRIGNEEVSQELSLIAIDIVSGHEIWSREIRDTRYRGPYPP